MTNRLGKQIETLSKRHLPRLRSTSIRPATDSFPELFEAFERIDNTPFEVSSPATYPNQSLSSTFSASPSFFPAPRTTIGFHPPQMPLPSDRPRHLQQYVFQLRRLIATHHAPSPLASTPIGQSRARTVVAAVYLTAALTLPFIPALVVTRRLRGDGEGTESR